MDKNFVTIFLCMYVVLCFVMAWKASGIVKINEKFLHFYWTLFGYEVTLKKIYPHRGERITQAWALLCGLFTLALLAFLHFKGL